MKMQSIRTRAAIALLALGAASSAAAQDDIRALADATGLSERKVQMIVGNRTPFAEYRSSYSRAVTQFRRAVGDEQYQRFVAGQPIDLDAVARIRDARLAQETRVAAQR